MKLNPARLYRAAQAADRAWSLETPEDMPIVSFEDERYGLVEHLCHELAHAALLGVKAGPRLSDRVSYAIRHLDDDRLDNDREEQNEVETCAVVLGVLYGFEIAVDRHHMRDVATAQTGWSQAQVDLYWDGFIGEPRYHQALDEVSARLRWLYDEEPSV